MPRQALPPDIRAAAPADPFLLKVWLRDRAAAAPAAGAVGGAPEVAVGDDDAAWLASLVKDAKLGQ